MTLDRHLVRSRWLLGRLGAESFTALKGGIESAIEGPRGDGHSHFLGHLDRAGVAVDWNRLEAYDLRVMDLERHLTRARADFRGLKYFQYADARQRPAGAPLSQDQEEPALAAVEDFSPGELRRLAFFMATGSGKTRWLYRVGYPDSPDPGRAAQHIEGSPLAGPLGDPRQWPRRLVGARSIGPVEDSE